jgi:serine/threonine protein kinase
MKTVNPRWGRIQELFNRAADMPLAERGPFLDVECGTDAVLRKELDELLAADAGPPSEAHSGIRASLLTHAISIAIDKTTRDRRSELIGTVVGSYRLTAVLGHGGAGTVYLGERADRQYSAQVAVKVVENALMHEEIAKRFQAERQILANLNHPHIARLLDAGETQNGQPFLVMEYVHGEPIDRYCDGRQLSLTQRLQLFIKVCAAVQYAHQNLIVHRDLKPGNILVTADGTPKLLDFGIAKLMDASAKVAAEMTLTRVNDRVLTPEYASPEQILGQNVTTTSDVYALGIVLYELLTGTRPYQVNSVSQLELERSICVTDPPRPSLMVEKLTGRQDASAKPLDVKAIAAARGLGPKRLSQALVGDLDAIVMRALRKEPERRYSSVEQLVEDIKRQLDQQPVLARQGNWLYYTKRFVKRHALGVGMSAAAAMALVAFSIIMSVQAKRIAEQRDMARQEGARAESVSNFMLEVFTAADPFQAQGKDITAKELLDKAGQRIAGDLNQQPEVRARLLAAIGRSYQRQGQAEAAVKYLEDALHLQRAAKNPNQVALATTLEHLGVALRARSDFAGAKATFDEAHTILGNLQQTQTPLYLQLLTDMGRLEQFRGDLTSAKKYFEQSLALSRQLNGNAHPETAGALLSLAYISEWRGDGRDAETKSREAAAIYRATLPDKHPDRVMADMSLGDILFRHGKLDEAAELTERGLSVQKEVYGSSNVNIAGSLDILGLIQQGQGKWEAAEATAREALQIVRRSKGQLNLDTANFQVSLADVLIKRKKYAEAELELKNALDTFQKIVNADNQFLASAEYLYGEVMVATGRNKQAVALLHTNIERWQQAKAPAWRAARSSNLLGVALMQLHKTKEGRTLLEQSYKVLSANDSGATSGDIAAARQRMSLAGL